MLKIIKSAGMLILLACLHACILDKNETGTGNLGNTGDQTNTPGLTGDNQGNSQGTTNINGTDNPDSKVNSDGSRKPRKPMVRYSVNDSIVTIRISGSGEGEEKFFWIYRNDSLLDIPLYQNNGIEHTYLLIDSVKAPGIYRYYSRYGEFETALSEPTETFLFEYPGRSRSGRISLTRNGGTEIRVSLSVPREEIVYKAVFERRIGPSGPVVPVDTVANQGSGSRLIYRDTSLIRADTVIFYRAKALDALSEQWLAPTPWDSIIIENEKWKYLPVVSFENTGTEIEAHINNKITQAAYYLYRNVSPAKEGKVPADSIPRGRTVTRMQDKPASPGIYYYWVEAYDSYGRVCPRSLPVPITYSGKSTGPSIYSLSTSYNAYVQVRISVHTDAIAYVLERTQDTTQVPVAVDTVSSAPNNNYVEYRDKPPENGKLWYYRARAILFDMSMTEPGNWRKTTNPWSYRPSYSSMTATVLNRGKYVVARISKSSTNIFRLYRSLKSDRSDSVVVDIVPAGNPKDSLQDTPPIGTYFYWVERTNPTSPTIYRSLPVQVEFTGANSGPAISAITGSSNGLRINISSVTHGDTVEVWRSTASPTVLETFTLVGTVSKNNSAYPIGYIPPPSPSSYLDTTATAAGFYHYRLIARRSGELSGWGPVKSIYYDGEP